MVDKQLLAILQRNGKIEESDISDALFSIMEDFLIENNVSVPAIASRVKGNVVQYYTTMPARYSKTGKRHQIVEKTEEEVKRQFLQEAYNTLNYVVEKSVKESITVQEVVKKYLDSLKPQKVTQTGKRKRATIERYFRIYYNYVENTEFGSMRMQSVKSYHCEDFIQYLYGREICAGYVTQIKSLVKTAFDYAVSRDLADKNYMVSIPINGSLCSTKKEREKTVWEDDEVVTLCQKSLEWWQSGKFRHSALLPALIFLGCRIGELSALTWNDVDFVNRTVTFDKTIIEYTDYETHQKCRTVDAPKRPDSRRTVYMNDGAMFWLKEIKRRNEETGIDSPNVVVTKTGRIPKEDQLATSFKRMCQNAGIPYKTSHTCRRTYTTVMIDGGVPVSQVSADLGHKKVSTTLDTYYRAKKQTEEVLQMKNDVFNQVYGEAMSAINLATLGNTPKTEPVRQKALQIR